MDDDPEAPFSPTHVVVMSELSQAEKETYFDLLIAAEAQFHQDHENNTVLADMRILGPGVKIEVPVEEKKEDGPRLTTAEKLAIKAATPQKLSGSIDTAAGGIFHYQRYANIVKLIMPKNKSTAYKPKRRSLAWVMRLIHEIYDVRYAKDTGDIGEDEFEDGSEEEMAKKREREEMQRQTNVFPIFIVDLLSKKFGLKSIVEQTVWDLIYSCDDLRAKDDPVPDIEVFCRFLEEYYDSDELLYYCYVRSLTQSVLNANFKTHWADPGKAKDGAGYSAGIDRKPLELMLNRRECNYIAQTIFIRNRGEEIEQEKEMFNDFMHYIDNSLNDQGEVDSCEFMRIAVERYFITRPQNEGEDAPAPLPPAPPEQPAEEEPTVDYDHPLLKAIFSGQSVETAEAEYVDEVVARPDFADLTSEVLVVVKEDLCEELTQRLHEAEKWGTVNAKSEREFQDTIANAVYEFDGMAKLVAEHAKGLQANPSGGA
mmetsp:Transcript_20126/g.42131  ORF Transcript_20126/g.42131 Transcript_20126/m.42131 type:complete len:483 (-) Transcript_20126:84-1532(-)